MPNYRMTNEPAAFDIRHSEIRHLLRPRSVPDSARDPAKVEDQVQFLARALTSVECGVASVEYNSAPHSTFPTPNLIRR